LIEGTQRPRVDVKRVRDAEGIEGLGDGGGHHGGIVIGAWGHGMPCPYTILV
jgi:hypothetical protein